MIKLDLNPSARTLRQFGLIGLVMFPVFATAAHFKLIAFAALPDGAVPPTVYVLAGLGVYCGLAALVWPKALKPLYVTMTVLFFPIGVVVFHLLMGVVYYLVITPVGLVFKPIGRDALKRKSDPSAETSWMPRKPVADVKRYSRQF